MELIARGSEAFIYLHQDKVIKERIRRPFFEEALDNPLRKKRTTQEYNILKKLQDILPVPKVYHKHTYSFEMEYIPEPHPPLTPQTAHYLGEILRKLHSYNLIHYDLTIFNLLGEKIIDFGLSFYSHKLEDKAMDLLVTLSEAPGYEEYILEGYKDEKVIKRMEEIKRRARYV